ncbi:discoidin domain-containing protein [Bacteroides salyersiae]|uniref:discoidin domain-containing protein n=1 Tax=Bacteroides salyersiae TaxID=291644 RepID=UPI001C8BBD53|nr:discoidin domain-containing protein [Bacteroides salyersiae]
MKKITTLLAGILLVGFTSVQAQDEDETLENLALNKEATANSQYRDNLGAQYAFDGIHNNNSRWSALGGSVTDEWIQVDFGEPVTFDKVSIDEYNARIKDYAILVSDDGENWLDAATGTNTDPETSKNHRQWEVTFEAVTNRYMRLHIYNINLEKDLEKEPSIWEIEVYNTAGSVGFKSANAETDGRIGLTIDGEELRIETAQAMNSVKVTDLSGRTVIEQPFVPTIFVGNLLSGVYLVQLEAVDGTLITRKILKK